MIGQAVTWDEVGEVMSESMSAALFAVAKEVFVGARDRTPIRTGFLSSEWTISGSGEAADVTNPGGSFDPAPDPSPPEDQSLKTLYVLNPTNYAIFVEYGTVHMEPRYMLTLAAAEVQARVESIVAPYIP